MGLKGKRGSEYSRLWRLRNPEKHAANRKRANERRKLPENAAKRRVYVREWYHKLRREVMAAYGSKCSCCGESEKEFLSFDHINGRGVHFKTTDSYNERLSEETRKARTIVRGSFISFLQFLKKNGFPKDDYRLLCMNCNWAIGRWGYCPHSQKTVSS